ncbi:DUF3515 domain-containing protein [Haloechinothrix halophila]|uniref:DUF3515 domain-containing protein n=1 Tax=Haloechinothrix halophila TaxID=1069073 RepID=UPI0003F82CA7|nr:DUF3515 domain-containing protein [Haloechinothrix halophila]
MSEPDAAAPSRSLIIVAAVLGLGLVAAVVAIGIATGGGDTSADDADKPTGPLPLVAVAAPESGSAACTTLTGALPDTLESAGKQLPRRELADPAPEGAAAWGAVNPVVLRCGIPKPGTLTKTAKLRQVNGVQWLPVTDQGATTWYAVDRKAYIALTVPADAGTGPLQEISDIIDAELTAVPPRP